MSYAFRARRVPNDRRAQFRHAPCPPLPIRHFCSLLAVLQLTALAAVAHPVAQGTMNLVVSPDSLEIQARVSTEEVFVAEAFGSKSDGKGSLDDVWRRHGAYF